MPCVQRAQLAFGCGREFQMEMPSPQSYWKEWEAVARLVEVSFEMPQRGALDHT